MSDLYHQIELFEARANEAELLAALACEDETRRRNRLLAEKLRDEAQALRRQLRSIAA